MKVKFVFNIRGSGILLPTNKEIAMKFTPLAEKKAADDEYEMFSYLHAINDPEVEKYGIPAVYYYGVWNQLIMTGFSLLDNNLVELVDSKEFFESDVNVLLVLRNFVSKKRNKSINNHSNRLTNIQIARY